MHPLSGIQTMAHPATKPTAAAARLLAHLGASSAVDRVDGPPAPEQLAVHEQGQAGEGVVRLTGAVPAVAGVPAGVAERACAACMALGALVSLWSGNSVEVDPRDVIAQLMLPLVIAVLDGFPLPAPSAPRRWGAGWLAAELSAPGDEDMFTRLAATLSPAMEPAAVAEAAQAWRLPVAPYLPPSASAQFQPPVEGVAGHRLGRLRPLPVDAPAEAPLAGVVVLDATVMWSGPLATWILSALGAEVWKIEPDCRLDGMRARGHRASACSGRPARGAIDPSPMFAALNRGKRRWNLDLRDEVHRNQLVQASREADLVIDNLSPRARGQLGLTRDDLAPSAPGIVTVTVPAFGPLDPRRTWVAYGSMIHAIRGLGWRGRGAPRPAAVAYADALTGLHAAVTCVAALIGRRRGWVPRTDLEVPLAASVAGLPARGHAADNPLDQPTYPFVANLVAPQARSGQVIRVPRGTSGYPPAPVRILRNSGARAVAANPIRVPTAARSVPGRSSDCSLRPTIGGTS